MSENRERDLQDWFDRSVQELAPEPFTRAVMEQVRRKRRGKRLQRYAALLMGSVSVCLLLPELVAPLNMLATLPIALISAGGAHWRLLVLLVAGLAYWLITRSRHGGILGVYPAHP